MSRMDRFGGMPFAVIAVALLLASTAMVAMVHQYGGTEDGADDLEDGIDAVDMAVADVQAYVNRGLGEIVRGLSTASDGVTDAASPSHRTHQYGRHIRCRHRSQPYGACRARAPQPSCTRPLRH